MVAIHLTLKKDLTARIEIENTAIHAGDVQREQTAAVRESATKVTGLSGKRPPGSPRFGKQGAYGVQRATCSEVLF